MLLTTAQDLINNQCVIGKSSAENPCGPPVEYYQIVGVVDPEADLTNIRFSERLPNLVVAKMDLAQPNPFPNASAPRIEILHSQKFLFKSGDNYIIATLKSRTNIPTKIQAAPISVGGHVLNMLEPLAATFIHASGYYFTGEARVDPPAAAMGGCRKILCFGDGITHPLIYYSCVNISCNDACYFLPDIFGEWDCYCM